MDSFDDQNFGHILRDLATTNEIKEDVEEENVEMTDFKILTPLEIPKSKSQLNFCKSLTEKLKCDDPSEFSLTEIEPCEPVKNVCSVVKDDCYPVPNSFSPIVANTPTVVQESLAVDAARQEIIACLSDLPSETPDNHNCNNLSEKTVTLPVPGDKSEKTSTASQDEIKITQSKFFQQKLKSSNPTSTVKRKSNDTSIHEGPTKQRINKSKETCMYFPGMIVWAKITGYSYWPAMIDNDPDVNSFTWLTDSSNLTLYHVVFFDTNGRLSRSWVKPHYIKAFSEVVRISNTRPKDYIERFKRSVKEAKEAMNLSLDERLKKYSFKERLKLPGTILCQD